MRNNKNIKLRRWITQRAQGGCGYRHNTTGFLVLELAWPRRLCVHADCGKCTSSRTCSSSLLSLAGRSAVINTRSEFNKAYVFTYATPDRARSRSRGGPKCKARARWLPKEPFQALFWGVMSAPNESGASSDRRRQRALPTNQHVPYRRGVVHHRSVTSSPGLGAC